MNPRLLRSIHTYASLVAFTILILFCVTGVMLNHPEIFEAEAESVVDQFSMRDGDEASLVQFLLKHGATLSNDDIDRVLDGSVLEYDTPGRRVSVAFLSPDQIEVELVSYGISGFITDLHKGRYASMIWLLFVDIISLFILLMCLTGLYIGLTSVLRRKQSVVILLVAFFISIFFAMFA